MNSPIQLITTGEGNRILEYFGKSKARQIIENLLSAFHSIRSGSDAKEKFRFIGFTELILISHFIWKRNPSPKNSNRVKYRFNRCFRRSRIHDDMAKDFGIPQN